MLFEIIKTCQDNPATDFKVDQFNGTEEDAIHFARLYAEQHYKGIRGDTNSLRSCRYGAKFITNNGTPVSYTIKH